MYTMTYKILMGLIFTCLIFGLVISPAHAQTDGLPDRAIISGVQGRAQRFNLSCESRSAVDWAAFWGVSIGEKQFLKHLPHSDNPDSGFVGEPNGVWGNIPPLSYGVHAAPVAALLREFGLHAEARYGMSWEELRAEVVAGRPVIVWVIGQMWKGSPVKYSASGGQKAMVARFEHTMIFYGYDKKKVYVFDAYTGSKQVYPIRTFLNSWKTLGRMAIVGHNSDQQNAPTTESSTPDHSVTPSESRVYLPSIHNQQIQPSNSDNENTNLKIYVVKRGEYLVDLGGRFGVDLRFLARLNGLQYPYVIHAGQVLRIR